MSYILAFDQGTTSSRAILFDKNGLIKNIAQKEFQQIFPKPGWVEHDPNEIWSTQIGVASEVISKIGVDSNQIKAIGITNQRETTIVWDKNTGEPVYNAIVWQDRRTANYCDRLKKEGFAGLLKKKTGLIIDAYFSGTKIKWILDNVEGARKKAENGDLLFGTVDSWLIWKMTRGERHVTDVTNASRTLLYNIYKLEWDQELLDLFEIPRAMLPEVASSSEVYGETRGDAFGQPVPIAGIAGDQQAALFGQICTKPGMAKNTYGTGCFLLMQTGEEPIESENNLLTTIASKINGKVQYALEGSVFMGGAVVQWLRDGLGLIKYSAEVEELARKVNDNDGVYLVPAFAGLGAPHWDPYARGTLVGMTRGTNASHIARAALESIAFQSADLISAMESDSGIQTNELRVDGGATANDLLMQFQSDILQVPVVRPVVSETTALGAGYLAGLAVGFWKDIDEIQTQWEIDKRFEPNMSKDRVSKLMKNWEKALGRAKKWSEE